MNELVLKQFVDEGLSQRQIADKLDLSQATVKYWLEKFGFKTKHLQFGTKNGDYFCKFCGETDSNLFALRHKKPCHTICKSCDNKRTVNRSRENKIKALEYKGCCCSVCGYDKNPAALSFHHLDPKQKDTNFDKMKFWKFDRIKKELDKCILVCLNCHAEIHNPMEE